MEGRGERELRSGESAAEGRGGAVTIAAVYAVFGVVWILFSDHALKAVVGDAALRDDVQTIKGVLYVLVTAVLLFLAIVRHRAGLAERDRRLRGVLDTMADAVVVADRHGRIVDRNAAAAAMLGDEDDLSRITARLDVRHGDGRAMRHEDTAVARALGGETVRAMEALVRAPNGGDAFLSVSAAPLLGPSGQPELAVLVMRDVSDVKRFEAMREEFLASAAHELKTPLAVVKAYAQLMHKRAQGDPAALSAISRQVDRLHRIVQQLLEAARFRVGGGELRRERFDLGELAEEVVRSVHGAHGRVVVARAQRAAVEADRDRIAQVVAALVENALRFSPGGAGVQASITRGEREAVVAVRDHGVGIPPERQGRIFERFYRAHAGTPEDLGGLGLGLDVSREIVARHGGRIWFESEPGAGSTFSFSLPLAAEEAR